MTKVVVIGAGNGGLTTAVLLAKAGLDVEVLEAHTYPGGSAGTFRRKRFRFDAGATLAGGFNSGEIMQIIRKEAGIESWNAKTIEPAMVVHLPSGVSIRRFGDKRRWEERITHFGEKSLSFWKWQEKTADAMWDFSSRNPRFPPQTVNEGIDLLSTTIKWVSRHLFDRIHLNTIFDAILPTERHLRDQDSHLRRFVDAQLLISTQTISRYANSLFSAAALDLPRRGVVHFKGGMGRIAEQLAEAFHRYGGIIRYKHQVSSIDHDGRKYKITTTKGYITKADIVIANLTPWNLRDVMKKPPPPLIRLPPKPKGWGAFMLHIGINDDLVPEDIPLHHQVLGKGSLTEGNSIFISLSPVWDKSRAPEGKRAITISTHTNFSRWWKLYNQDHSHQKLAYNRLKEQYKAKILSLASRVVPKIAKAELIEAGTPLTFQHFTQRKLGWVGGFRQEHLFKTFGPRVQNDLWIVGDSIFPGQSTAAVSLGGMRVAKSILEMISE